MKVEEYARMFYSVRNVEELKKLAFEVYIYFMEEGSDMMKERDSNSDHSFITIQKELNMKWNSLCTRISQLRENGYRDFLFSQMPELKSQWDKHIIKEK